MRDNIGYIIVCLILAFLVVLAATACQGKWDNRANGGELIEIGTPCNPCQPAEPETP